jgi:hypothetical protein
MLRSNRSSFRKFTAGNVRRLDTTAFFPLIVTLLRITSESAPKAISQQFRDKGQLVVDPTERGRSFPSEILPPSLTANPSSFPFRLSHSEILSYCKSGGMRSLWSGAQFSIAA